MDIRAGKSMKMKNIVTLCILALLIGSGVGCRKNNGSKAFSFDFNSEQEDALVLAVKMYTSVCQALESRDFRKLEVAQNPEMIRTQYDGKYEGFPLTIEIHYLLSVSEENPEFHYRVSFEEVTEEAAKDFRVLMSEWCGFPAVSE